ncbi:MAG: DLW-39 family protein [Actinomycetes bacterium]
MVKKIVVLLVVLVGAALIARKVRADRNQTDLWEQATAA